MPGIVGSSLAMVVSSSWALPPNTHTYPLKLPLSQGLYSWEAAMAMSS
jgi:hypothetical protein